MGRLIVAAKPAAVVLPWLLLAALGLGGCAPQKRVVVYTAAEADQLPRYAAAFKSAHPDIDLVWVRDSTGVLTAKLLAEKKAPRADAVFATAATSILELDEQGVLAPYAPLGVDRLEPRFRDAARPPHWDGEALFASAICVNTIEAAKRGLPIPQTWEDLTKPIYKGAISMPDPAASGTGLMTVNGWLQTWGQAKGWDYMDRLDKNIVSYDPSGSKPCKDAARGEVPIGISFDFRASSTKSGGAPIAVVVPPSAVGWDLESSAVVAGAAHPKAAQIFVDWAMSDAAMKLYADSFSIVAVPSFNKPAPYLPTDLASRLAPVDLAWSARNRVRILAEWSRRYQGKAARKE
jgi:iron(III) transport system substrate-binding protein